MKGFASLPSLDDRGVKYSSKCGLCLVFRSRLYNVKAELEDCVAERSGEGISGGYRWESENRTECERTARYTIRRSS